MMKYLLLAAFCPMVLAHPAVLETRQSGQSIFTSLGSALNNQTSASKRKAQMISAGATSLDIAIGMHEMGVTFASTADWKGHSDPHACGNWADPTGCTNGKANCYLTFGMFNNNWWQMTTSCTQFKGLSECDQAKGLIINSDYNLMISCQHQQMADPKFNQGGDLSGWWVGQRDGGGGYDLWKQTGQMDRTTKDYMNNVLTIKHWIDVGNHMHDNWVMSSNIDNLDAPVTNCEFANCGTPYVDNTPIDAADAAAAPVSSQASSTTPPTSSSPAGPSSTSTSASALANTPSSSSSHATTTATTTSQSSSSPPPSTTSLASSSTASAAQPPQTSLNLQMHYNANSNPEAVAAAFAADDEKSQGSPDFGEDDECDSEL